MSENQFIKQTRWTRFMCWVQTGHVWNATKSQNMASRTMNTCMICKKVEAGPD